MPNWRRRKPSSIRPELRSKSERRREQFAETTYQRWRDSPKGVVSEQEQESKQADYNSAAARV